MPRCVLLVDDSPDAIAGLAVILRKEGHEVHLAYDGLAAVETAVRVQPDVVLLDIGLPLMDGYAAAAQIREKVSRDGLVLAAITGRSAPADRERAEAAGFTAHLVKPVDLDELLRLVGGL